jgi:type IV secretory pathway component VirB8
MEIKNHEEINQNQIYIKKRFENKKFFEDAKDWFYNKYASPYKSRLNLIILILTLFFFFTVMLLSSLFNILGTEAKNGIISLESEFEDEFVMKKINKYYSNNEKNILRFIIENYVTYFESYEYSKYDIYKLNENINMIRKYSSKSLGDKFERIVKNNYTTEIFGGFTRDVKIKSFEFVVQDYGLREQVLNYLLPEKTPNKVVVNLVSTLYSNGGRFIAKEENRVVEITFQYKSLNRDKDGNFNSLDFQVISYNYILI